MLLFLLGYSSAVVNSLPFVATSKQSANFNNASKINTCTHVVVRVCGVTKVNCAQYWYYTYHSTTRLFCLLAVVDFYESFSTVNCMRDGTYSIVLWSTKMNRSSLSEFG